MTTHGQKYGAAHQRLRRQWAVRVERGDVNCARCGGLIRPGSAWHLDHDDRDPTRYLGPSHARCNLSTWHRLSPSQQARSAWGKGWNNVTGRRGTKRPAPKPKPKFIRFNKPFSSEDW